MYWWVYAKKILHIVFTLYSSSVLCLSGKHQTSNTVWDINMWASYKQLQSLFFIVRFPFIYVRGCIAWYVFGWGISPECYYASNHQQCDCLFNSLFRLTSMHQSFTLLSGRFLAQRASNTESVSVSGDTTVVTSDLVPEWLGANWLKDMCFHGYDCIGHLILGWIFSFLVL